MAFLLHIYASVLHTSTSEKKKVHNKFRGRYSKSYTELSWSVSDSQCPPSYFCKYTDNYRDAPHGPTEAKTFVYFPCDKT